MGMGSRVRGMVVKTLLLIGGAVLLKWLAKSTTRWDHACIVGNSFTGQKFSMEQASRAPDNNFNFRMLTCPAAEIVDGSKVLYFEQAFWRTSQKPFRQRFYMVKPCPKELKCDVEVSSYAIRDAEEYKNFCDRPEDQCPLPEEVLGKKMKLLEFPTLRSLKQLELIAHAKANASLLGLTSLLKAAPVLCRLTLKMAVVEAYVGEKKIDHPENKSELSPMLYSLLIEGIAQNTNGGVYASEGGVNVEVSGSPTEKAILSRGVKLGMNFEAMRSESSVMYVFPFNSEKKTRWHCSATA